MTGADSPVIALSSTVATPSITSPSAGIDVAGLAPARGRPCAGVEPGTSVPGLRASPASASFFAITSRRVPRSAAACALPRPSATLSAKLANSTVNHSQSETREDEAGGASPCAEKRLDPEQRRQHAADLDHEHHRVLPLHPRIELDEGFERRRAAGSARSGSCMAWVGDGHVTCSRVAGARRSARARAPARR